MTLTSKYGTVEVTVVTATRKDGAAVPTHFEVTGSSSYRAVLAACLHDDYGPKFNCPKRYGHGVPGKAKDRDEHNRTHCHGWHQESVLRFAQDVLKTYKGGTT